MNDLTKSAIATIGVKLNEQSRSKLNSIAKRFISITNPQSKERDILFSEIMKEVKKLIDTKYQSTNTAEFKNTINKLMEGLISENVEQPFSEEEESIENVEELEEETFVKKTKSIKLSGIKKCICTTQNQKSLGLKEMLVKCSNSDCGNRFHIKCIKWKRDKSKPFMCPKCIILSNDPANEVQNTLIEPRILTNEEIYDFVISFTDFKLLENKVDKTVGVEIRCLKLDGKGINYQTWPDSGTLKLGNTIIAKFKPLHQNSALKKRKDEKFFGRQVFRLGKNQLTFAFENKLDGKNSDLNSDPQYIFTVVIVKKLKVEDLAEKIINSSTLSIKESKEFLQDRFLSQNDLEISEIRADLKCKLSLTLLEDPARGKNCKHVDCFNLVNFLKTMNSSRTRKWVCPLCKKWCSEIVVDSYMKQVVDEASEIGGPEAPEKVTFYQDGTYKFHNNFPGNKNPLEDYMPSHEQNQIMEVLSICSNSDDEDTDNINRNNKARSVNNSLEGKEINLEELTKIETAMLGKRRAPEYCGPKGLKIDQNFREDEQFLKKFYKHYSKSKSLKNIVWNKKNLQEFKIWKDDFLDLCNFDALFAKKVTLLYKILLDRTKVNKDPTELRYERIIANYSSPTWAFTTFQQTPSGDIKKVSKTINNSSSHTKKEKAILSNLIRDYSRQNESEMEPELQFSKLVKDKQITAPCVDLS